jgi:hypothetical protein
LKCFSCRARVFEYLKLIERLLGSHGRPMKEWCLSGPGVLAFKFGDKTYTTKKRLHPWE